VRKAIEMKERFSNVKQRLGKSIPWRDHTHGGEITEASEMSSPQKKFIKLRQQIEQNRGGQQPQRQTSETKKGGEDDVRRVAQSEGKHGQGRGGRGVRGAGKGGNQRAES
jgi:hypothetical protein